MTRRNLFIAAGICILGIVVNILLGCQSTSKAEKDVWELLARGEGDKARPFFLGSVDVNARDGQGRTPLHLAAEIEDSLLAGFFISLGAEVDAVDGQGRTPLAISAEKQDAPTASVIAAAGADIHHEINDGRSPARIAVQGNAAFLQAILNSSSILKADSEGRTILHLAAEAGNARAVDAVLKSGGITGQTDSNGKTALDLALERHDSRDHAEAAESLILAGSVSDKPLYGYFAPAVRTSNYNLRNSDGMAPLHFMAREIYTGYLEFVLEKRVDVNIKSASGATPLHEAARSGNIRIMEMLLDKGADVYAQDAKGNSVLHIAIPRETHAEAVKLFISRGADPNLRDEHGDSPLHISVTLNRSDDVLHALLLGGADVTVRNLAGKTPLFVAVENNRESSVPILLAYRSDVFAVDNDGVSPFEKAMREFPAMVFAMISSETVLQNDSAGNTMLHIAVIAGGDTFILNRILDYNAHVDARNNAGDTSLLLAVRHNEKVAGEILLSRGANIFASNARGESPLFLTFPNSGRSDAELRQWMLNPQTLSAHDGLGNTALHYTAQWQMDRWIPHLIGMGANTEAPNATGETPLFTAVKNNFPSTIRVLAANGAQLSSRDSLGNTALHAAVRWHSLNGAGALIDLGIDVNSHNLNGRTPLHETIRMGITNIESLLLRHGANVEVRDSSDGNTPFMEALIAGNTAAMERLVTHGADSGTRNFRGDTPLHIAVAMERTDIITLLLSWGASIHARNSRNRTPFQDALITSPNIVRTLLTRDRLFSSDDNGASPLHIAVQERASLSSISAIMEMGARLSTLDSEGRTPLRLSVDVGLLEISRYLADSGADVFINARDGRNAAEISLERGEETVRAVFSGRAIFARDSSGNTVLHYAAKHGNPVLVSQLLSLGAGKDSRNIAAESPADIAVRWNHGEVASLLFN